MGSGTGSNRVFLAALLVVAVGCGGDDDGGGDGDADGEAVGTARMLNGASPDGAQALRVGRAAAAADGNWQVSPDAVRAPLVGIRFEGTPAVTVPVSDCVLEFDLLAPGLAESLTCPFTLPAGTYVGAGPVYGETFELRIDDDVNGMYTDPDATSMLSGTEPAGGAQLLTLPNPRAEGGVQVTLFPEPVVVEEGDEVSVSILLAALQSFQVSVTGDELALGVDGNGMPGFPDAVTSVGTPAAIAFHVNPVLATPYSYNGMVVQQDGLAISVLYTSDMTPAFLGMSNGDLPGCGHIQALFLFPGDGNGYLGLDADDVLGWAGTNDGVSAYSTVMSMPQATAQGAMTTFKCLETTTDPAPAGGSFSSGAPDIPAPTAQETMTVVAN